MTAKTHYTGSQNSDTTVPSGRELYHLQFSLQAASPETIGSTLVYMKHFSKYGRGGWKWEILAHANFCLEYLKDNRNKWKHTIKIDRRKVGCEVVDWNRPTKKGSKYGLCEHGDELLVFLDNSEFLE
jgi:hypothetical protein